MSEDKIAGFDFLGFHIQQYKAGKHNCSHNGTHLTGHITLITPNHKSIKKHQEKLGEEIRNHRSQPIDILIFKLNPIIRGWVNYYKYSDIKNVGICNKMTHLTNLKMRSWAKHSCNSVKDGLSRYYHKRQYTKLDGNKSHRKEWSDSRSAKLSLMQHGDIETTKKGYVKVKGNRSPYDGDVVYWGKRLQSHPELSTRELRLLKVQKGKCNWCGLHFMEGDNWEVDHIIPKSRGGKDIYDNLQLLHSHCHDSKTSKDGSCNKKSEKMDNSKLEPKKVKQKAYKPDHLDLLAIERNNPNYWNKRSH